MPNSKYNEDVIYYGKQFPEVTVYPRYRISLKTYHPITSKYPWTGHSELRLEKAITDPNTGKMNGYYTPVGGVNISFNSNDYNLVTNNCADGTRRALETTFGKSLNPFLFTTPGDVRDFLIDQKGKLRSNLKGVESHHKYLTEDEVNRLKTYLQQNTKRGGGIWFNENTDDKF